MKINHRNYARGFLLRGRVAVLTIVLVIAGLFAFATPAWATQVRVVDQDGNVYNPSGSETHETWSWDGSRTLTLDGFNGQEISFYGGNLRIVVKGINMLSQFDEEFYGGVRYAPYGESPNEYMITITGGGALVSESGISNLGGVTIDNAAVEIDPLYPNSDKSCQYVLSALQVSIKNDGTLMITEGGISTGRLLVSDSTLDVSFTYSDETPVILSEDAYWWNSFISVQVKEGNSSPSVTSRDAIHMTDEFGGFDGNEYAMYGDVSLVPTGFVVLTDLQTNTPHLMDILWLYSVEITQGFPDGTFRPYANVTRCDMAAFLYRLAGSPSYTPTEADRNRFNDVNEGTDHCVEIWWLASKGISTGFSDGGFHPYETVKRCDMAAFLNRLADATSYSPTSADRERFSDVNTGTSHAVEIWWLASEGISTGFPDGTFRPYAEVTRCDMAAFLHRLYRSLHDI